MLIPYSASEFANAVVGSWQVCTGLENLRSFTATDDVLGMQFAPTTSGGGGCAGAPDCIGGNLYWLVQGLSGLVPGSGSAYRGAYWIVDGELWLSPGSVGSWSTAILYSTDPRELDITTVDYTDGATLLGIP